MRAEEFSDPLFVLSDERRKTFELLGQQFNSQGRGPNGVTARNGPLFSNEAGMGSAPNTAATATVAHPTIQGFIQALGVFIDTIIVCSTTAFIILVSGLYDPSQPAAIAGASLTQAAIAQSFGLAGQWFMTLVVFAFAFSSVLGNYAYADVNLTFLGCGRATFLVFRIVALFAVMTGSITSLPIIWAVADVAMGVMRLLK